jgi:hypothetical protein
MLEAITDAASDLRAPEPVAATPALSSSRPRGGCRRSLSVRLCRDAGAPGAPGELHLGNRLAAPAWLGLLAFMAGGLVLAVLPAVALWVEGATSRASPAVGALPPASVVGFCLLVAGGPAGSSGRGLAAAVSVPLVSLDPRDRLAILAQPPLLPERLRSAFAAARCLLHGAASSRPGWRSRRVSSTRSGFPSSR